MFERAGDGHRHWAVGWIAALGLVLSPTAGVCASYRLTIVDMAFGPAPPNLRVGDTVEWVNADIFEHSATARDGSFDVKLPPKAHVRTVLKRAGPTAFYCRYHPGMTGVLAVAR